MASGASKKERLLNLICALIINSSLTFAEIKEKVHGYNHCETEEAARRMFERDKKELEKAGIKLKVENQKYYRLDIDMTPGTRMNLLKEEKNRLAEILAELKNFKGSFDAAALNSAIRKTAIALGILPAVLTAEASFSFQILPDENEKKFSSLIDEAIEKRKKLMLHYQPLFNQEKKEYIVEPSMLVLREGEWYLAGLTSNGPRLFKLKRIKEIKIIDDPIETPEEKLREILTDDLQLQKEQVMEVEIKCPVGFGDAFKRNFNAEFIKLEADSEYLRLNVYFPELFLFDFAPYLPVVEIVRPEEFKQFLMEKLLGILGDKKNAPQKQ
jgi:predicted DNA-binding transcriptional regulator YafY